jgi:hypothetical protein
MNTKAKDKRLALVPGADHLFEEKKQWKKQQNIQQVGLRDIYNNL